MGPDCTVLLLELQPAGRDEVAGHPAPPIKRAECALVGKGTQLTLAWSPCGRWVLAGETRYRGAWLWLILKQGHAVELCLIHPCCGPL